MAKKLDDLTTRLNPPPLNEAAQSGSPSITTSITNELQMNITQRLNQGVSGEGKQDNQNIEAIDLDQEDNKD